MKEDMKIYIDIDGVLAKFKKDNDYSTAKPDNKMIAFLNDLYNVGYIITIYSARGAVSGLDWFDVTRKQLEEWGVKYHNLSLKKPDFDLLIDDKAADPHCKGCTERIRNLIYKGAVDCV